jgi:hypothetical protein
LKVRARTATRSSPADPPIEAPPFAIAAPFFAKRDSKTPRSALADARTTVSAMPPRPTLSSARGLLGPVSRA